MWQRVMSAPSPVLNPKLLIADDPTTALEVTIQQQILTLVRRLQGETGMGVLWVSHDLGVLARLVQRVLVMYAGHAVESAAVQPLFGSPAHRYSAGLLASLRSLDDDWGRLHQIPGRPPEAAAGIGGRSFGPRWPQARDKRMQMPPTTDLGHGPHRRLLVPQGREGADVLSVQDLHKSYPARGGGSVQAVPGDRSRCHRR
jgi:oligopeptide/dipeptide ABC transporter ATP-binding protein